MVSVYGFIVTILITLKVLRASTYSLRSIDHHPLMSQDFLVFSRTFSFFYNFLILEHSLLLRYSKDKSFPFSNKHHPLSHFLCLCILLCIFIVDFFYCVVVLGSIIFQAFFGDPTKSKMTLVKGVCPVEWILNTF